MEFHAWSVKWLSKYVGPSAAQCVKVELSTNSGRMRKNHTQKSNFGQVDFSYIGLERLSSKIELSRLVQDKPLHPK